jgi:Ca2+-binding EF-hand superfamily protein
MKPAIHLLTIFLLASCESTPPVETAPDRFALADADNNGSLARAEMSDYVVGTIFATRDANQDGIMTPQEWHPDNDPAAVKGFRLRDANRDGNVSLAEARAYGRTAKAHDEVFNEADTNKDGGVSRTEVQAYYASKEGPFR